MRFYSLLLLAAAMLLSSCAHQAKKPEMVTRDQWGSDPDPIPEARQHEPQHVTIHHAGVVWNEGDDPLDKITGLQAWGKSDKGWPDLPYHYMIAPDGRIFEGRPLQYEAETNTDYDLAGHIGINVWGNFEEQRVSREQLKAVVDTAGYLCGEYNIDPQTIQGHRDVAEGQTVCPGKDLYRYIDQGLIQAWVELKLQGMDPNVGLLPPATDGPKEMIPGGGE